MSPREEWRLAARLHRIHATKGFKREGYASFRLFLHGRIGIAPSRGMRLVGAYEAIRRNGIPLSRVEGIPPIRIYTIREQLARPDRDVYLEECRELSARALEFRYGVFLRGSPAIEGPTGEDIVVDAIPDDLNRARERTLIEMFVDMLSMRDPQFISALLLALAKSRGRSFVDPALVIELAAHLEPDDQGKLVAEVVLEPGFSPKFEPSTARAIVDRLRALPAAITAAPRKIPNEQSR